MNPQDHIQWIGDAQSGHLRLLDQTRLPTETAWLDCTTVVDVEQAIKRLSVRGAPAIGIAAAYGCVIAAQANTLDESIELLAASRPTAVNLTWALGRMKRCSANAPDTSSLLKEARRIHDEDRASCRAIGEHALALLRELTDDHLHLLTHCNAGALATGGIGTATAPMYVAHEQGLPLRVLADETRPLLQGSRLTAWELALAGIDVSIITDSMAAHVMQQGLVRAVITGADRIAANGDSANKIGTHTLAIVANHYRIPFIIAAPTSTIDLDAPDGQSIPIEQRAGQEITHGFGRPTAPEQARTYSPAFDITPASLITAIVTQHGVIRPIKPDVIAEHVHAPSA